MKPLEGLVVLDLTRFLAGPYCTLLLAGLGADVVKVEAPGTGDAYRARPPFGGPGGAHLERRTPDDLGLTILHRARGKRSITLNLRHPEGIALFRQLCGRADVVVENFLPGTLERMGLGFPVLQAANPRLILCSISGFGQQGARREWRAFDPIVQAMSGISSITGYPDRPPVRCGASISDTGASLFATIGILSALRGRERTGRGDWVDVAMLDGSFFLLADVFEFVVAGVPAERLGNAHSGGAPFNVYRATDGWMSVCAVTAEEWTHLLAAIGRSELAGDPRFDPSPVSRRAHREDIDQLVQEWVGARTVDEAVATLQAHHVPAGPVRSVSESLADGALRARDMVVDLAHPTHGTIPGAAGLGMPIKFAELEAGFDRPAPALGADNDAVYGGWLGLDDARRAALRQAGVI